MEIKITWSTLAKQQLKDIGQYVADNFGERTANKSLGNYSAPLWA